MSTPFPPVDNPVLSVSALNRRVRDCLEQNFPLSWIAGEISNLTQAASGHVYFSLKDAQAQVRCVMWRSRAQLLGWRLENGQKVEIRALVSFYEPRGEFQLNVEAIRRAGQGDLFERFLRLKAQLDGEGLFAPERKRPLAEYPRSLAIVTSPQAAALRDVLSTLRRRAPYLQLTLYPTPVQGDGAGERIATALAAAAAGGHDAIILCRGGGSIEDLWAFNEEVVARAIAASTVPVVSGVGHETDFTIADFVADLRAPTPTAAAELVAPDRAALIARLNECQRRLHRGSERLLAVRRQQLDLLAARLLHPAQRLQQQRQTLHSLGAALNFASERLLTRRRERLGQLQRELQRRRPQAERRQAQLGELAHRLEQALHRRLDGKKMQLNTLAAGLKQLDPHAVLARGYAIAVGADGQSIRDAAQLSPGSRLQLSFARGRAAVTVDAVASEKSTPPVVATPEAQ